MVKVKEYRKEYENGLIAIAVPLKGKKETAFYVGVDVGSKNDPPEKKGCAHLLEHMLFSSNEFRTADKLAEDAEFNGMELNAFTSLTDTTLKFWLPLDKLDRAVELAHSTIVGNSYNQTEFDKEKYGPVATELNLYERNPVRRYFDRVLFPRIFEGTPLQDAIIGTFESVNKLKISDLLKLKRRFYVPNNMVVAAAGAVNPEKFFQQLENSFGSLKRAKVIQPDLSWKLQQGVKYVEFGDLNDPQNSSQDQAAVYVVYQVSGTQHQDAASLSLLETMLGTGFTSHLYKELRKQRGIGYSTEAKYISMRGNAVIVMGLSALHPDQLEEAVDVINNIVKMVKDGKIEGRFLEGKKNQLVSSLLFRLDTNAFNADTAISREFEKPFYSSEALIRKIKAIKAGELQDVARRNLSGEPLIVIASAPGYNNRYNK